MKGLTVCVSERFFSIPVSPPFWSCTVVEVFPNECIVAIDPSSTPTLHFEVGKRVNTRILVPNVDPKTHRVDFEPAPIP